MTQLAVETLAALQLAFERFLAGNDPDPLDLRTIAAHVRALPVVRGWDALAAIRLDGSLVEVAYEPPHAVTEISERSQVLSLLGHVATKFPELAALRPSRPDDAVTCPLCEGTGRSDTASYGICLCGGLGWLVHDIKGAA